MRILEGILTNSYMDSRKKTQLNMFFRLLWHKELYQSDFDETLLMVLSKVYNYSSQDLSIATVELYGIRRDFSLYTYLSNQKQKSLFEREIGLLSSSIQC